MEIDRCGDTLRCSQIASLRGSKANRKTEAVQTLKPSRMDPPVPVDQARENVRDGRTGQFGRQVGSVGLDIHGLEVRPEMTAGKY